MNITKNKKKKLKKERSGMQVYFGDSSAYKIALKAKGVDEIFEV